MRMFEHPNAALVERLYAAFDGKDVASLGKLIAEERVWHVPGTSPVSGDHRGQEASFAYFQKLAELTDGTFHAELIDVLVPPCLPGNCWPSADARCCSPHGSI